MLSLGLNGTWLLCNKICTRNEYVLQFIYNNCIEKYKKISTALGKHSLIKKSFVDFSELKEERFWLRDSKDSGNQEALSTSCHPEFVLGSHSLFWILYTPSIYWQNDKLTGTKPESLAFYSTP